MSKFKVTVKERDERPRDAALASDGCDTPTDAGFASDGCDAPPVSGLASDGCDADASAGRTPPRDLSDRTDSAKHRLSPLSE